MDCLAALVGEDVSSGCYVIRYELGQEVDFRQSLHRIREHLTQRPHPFVCLSIPDLVLN